MTMSTTTIIPVTMATLMITVTLITITISTNEYLSGNS
jgi:hypothetical protein